MGQESEEWQQQLAAQRARVCEDDSGHCGYVDDWFRKIASERVAWEKRLSAQRDREAEERDAAAVKEEAASDEPAVEV